MTFIPKKPMLGSAIKDFSKITFPKLISPKLDGIFCMIGDDGVVYSRSGKPIRSKAIQSLFGKTEYARLSGELIYGSPTAKDTFNLSTQFVMSAEVPDGFDPTQIKLYVFDFIDDIHPFIERCHAYATVIFNRKNSNIIPVPQLSVYSTEEMLDKEREFLMLGYEGAMLRNPHSFYKHGRATEKSQDLLKLKRFVDDEAIITGVEELMHNDNEQTTDVFGHSERSQSKDGLVGMNTLGALVCKTSGGVEFKIGTGFTQEGRKELWEKRNIIIGRLVKYKHFPIGQLIAPRLPVYLGIRDKDDL